MRNSARFPQGTERHFAVDAGDIAGHDAFPGRLRPCADVCKLHETHADPENL